MKRLFNDKYSKKTRIIFCVFLFSLILCRKAAHLHTTFAASNKRKRGVCWVVDIRKNMKTVQKIRQLCRKAGLSMSEVATLIGVPYRTLTAELKGSVSVTTLQQISNLLAVPMATFYEDEMKDVLQEAEGDYDEIANAEVCQLANLVNAWTSAQEKEAYRMKTAACLSLTNRVCA